MTISTTASYIDAPGNGVATTFTFPFKIFQASDLIVGFVVGGGYAQQTSGFTVNNVDNNGGGSVTFTTPPPLGTTVDLRTFTPQTQGTEFANLGSYLPESTTEAVDRLTRMVQDLYRLVYTFGVHGPDQETTPWTQLPAAANRAGYYLGFDSNGLPTLLAGTGGGGGGGGGSGPISAPAFLPTSNTIPTCGIYLPAVNTLGFATSSKLRGSVNAAGNWVFGAPDSGVAVTAVGAAGQYAEVIAGNATSGQSYGQLVQAGTTSADECAVWQSQAGSATFAQLFGNGEWLIAAPASVAQQLAQVGVYNQVGYLDAPQNLRSTNYTLALTDRGKSIFLAANNIVLTIPANASVGFPVGAVILICNSSFTGCTIAITSDTLVFVPSQATGTRSLAAYSIATLYKISATQWLIWGLGVS